MTDVHDLRGLQDRQKVMMAELQHRTRNLLAMVQTIAAKTLRSSGSMADFQREFERRIRSLSRVQVLITGVDYSNVDLRDLLTAELQVHDPRNLEGGKVRLDGPALPLAANAAQALGMALHELATNAAKYGALAGESGRLTVSWRVERHTKQRRAVLEWKETGVAMSSSTRDRRYGFGRELIERALPYQLGTETSFTFEPDGVRCTIAVDLKDETKNA